ncbi:MAG: hypothetical protein LLF83_10230 [Methanobacterium sp.]|nr:hypothetical protein [Methanobacterium sp.]
MQKLIKQLQTEYNGIWRIEPEEKNLVIFADEDTLWRILEDLRDIYNMEFEAGSAEEHYIRILL